MEKAHDLSKEERTLDVFNVEDIRFKDMLLSNSTLMGLERAGFKKPSPIQRQAIPLGRCGFDLIVQAKSGTGKTCVFTVIALEMLNQKVEKLQVVVLAPTREISVQIANVMSSISRSMGETKIKAFIGGMPLEEDKKKVAKCQIAVGAPGRMKHLISSGLMDLNAVRLFILDEADRLMQENFRKDISYIYSKLPCNKQMIAVSATFSDDLEKFVSQYMKNPMKVSPGEDTILIGVRQFVYLIPSHSSALVEMRNKTGALKKILSNVKFKQCLVFSNYQSRAESICGELNDEGWPAIFINGSQTQIERLKAYNALKEYRCRILLSTDLTSRGIDAENVNLIVNLDLPFDGATYLHRIGRAGRYGTYGIAVTIVQEGPELERFQKLLYEVGGENFNICIFPRENILFNIWEANEDSFEKLRSVMGSYEYVKYKKNIKKSKEKSDKAKTELRTEELISTIWEYRLPPTERLPLDSFECLANDLKNFQMNDEIDKPQNLSSDTEEITYVSPALKSSLIYLENDGWKNFYSSFSLSQPDCDPEKGANNTKESKSLNNVVYETHESCDDEIKNDDDEDYGDDSDDGDNDSNDSNDEYDDSDYLLEEKGKEDKSKNERIYFSTELETETGSEYETSQYSKDSEDESGNNYEREVFNNYMQHWYSLWRNQSSLIRHYVKYYHYWKEIVNAR